jgi:hypothetical protein
LFCFRYDDEYYDKVKQYKKYNYTYSRYIWRMYPFWFPVPSYFKVFILSWMPHSWRFYWSSMYRYFIIVLIVISETKQKLLLNTMNLFFFFILWVAFLDPSDSYFLFADLVGFYAHWTYMHIFRRIFLSNYWWHKSDIWSQASYSTKNVHIQMYVKCV